VTASDLVSLEADLPTSESDLYALRRAREASYMTPSDIVALLEQLGPSSSVELRARPVMSGEPFEL
jgi:hypothetical protein